MAEHFMTAAVSCYSNALVQFFWYTVSNRCCWIKTRKLHTWTCRLFV